MAQRFRFVASVPTYMQLKRKGSLISHDDILKLVNDKYKEELKRLKKRAEEATERAKRAEEATERAKRANAKLNKWYDKNSREREFQPNDTVLLLLPTATSKLLAQWQGPFRVVKKVGRVNYEIEMPHRRKKKQTYHTNLLKKWEPPSVLCSMASEVDDEEEDFPDWRENKTSQPAFGSQLTDAQRDDLAGTYG